MKMINIKQTGLIACFALTLIVQSALAQTYCIENSDQIAGVQDGYRYELWNQNAQGTACMTLGDGALFSGEWSGIENYLARRGLEYDQTQQHQEVGTFYATYDCNYNPSSASGNSYLSIYGWTVDPLIEFYIVEDWRNWIPSMAAGATSKGTFTANGSTYEIIENTRTNQPSIQGTATFQQYFSIRTNERNSGTINITDHFEQWESLGLELGNLHEVSFVVEGYQSSGDFNFTELDVFLSDEPISDPTDDVLSSETKKKTNLVSIYPNPNKGDVSIQLNGSVANADLNIYDSAGRIIISQKTTGENRVNISNLQSGIYIVNINSGGINYSEKLVVL